MHDELVPWVPRPPAQNQVSALELHRERVDRASRQRGSFDK